MPYYRKKPVVIHAEEWNGTVRQYEALLAKNIILTEVDPDDGSVYIPTLEGTMKCELGDFIIRGVEGEHYPCKPSIFNKTYERT